MLGRYSVRRCCFDAKVGVGGTVTARVLRDFDSLKAMFRAMCMKTRIGSGSVHRLDMLGLLKVLTERVRTGQDCVS